MASCGRNISTKNYQYILIGFQVTVENVWDVFRTQCIYLNELRTVVRKSTFHRDVYPPKSWSKFVPFSNSKLGAAGAENEAL